MVHEVLSVHMCHSLINKFLLLLFWKVQTSESLNRQSSRSLETRVCKQDSLAVWLALPCQLTIFTPYNWLWPSSLNSRVHTNVRPVVVVVFVWILFWDKALLSSPEWLCSTAGLKPVAIFLPLALECWNYRCVHTRIKTKSGVPLDHLSDTSSRPWYLLSKHEVRIQPSKWREQSGSEMRQERKAAHIFTSSVY